MQPSRQTALAIAVLAIAAFAALAGTADQALAGPANHYLEQASYYLKLARMSLETTNAVSSRKDKCIWARQTLGEAVVVAARGKA